MPFGVVGAIYEARPNVTIDIAALALKSGNAVVLRGGSAAENTNRVLVELLQEALESVGLPADAVQTIDEFGRDGATQLMQARGLVDVLIPRGSAQLIDTVVRESKVPVIETGAGVVHLYLDESADEAMAVEIAVNSKVQRPSVCNALETLLVDARAAERLLPPVLRRCRTQGVTVHADERARAIFPDAVPATDDDWSTEHMSLDLSVGVVDDLDAALDHIRRYSTHHTESIVTNDLARAERFLAEVDSAVVMVNASHPVHRRRRVRVRRRGRHLDPEAARARADGPARADQHEVDRARLRPGAGLTGLATRLTAPRPEGTNADAQHTRRTDGGGACAPHRRALGVRRDRRCDLPHPRASSRWSYRDVAHRHNDKTSGAEGRGHGHH